MTDKNIENQAEFQDKLKILCSERSDSNRSLWNKKQKLIFVRSGRMQYPKKFFAVSLRKNV